MLDDNVALWLRRPGSAMTVGAAVYPRPAPNEVVVRVRAVAVNPVDNLPGYLYPVILPWLRFPAVIGSDVAGVIVDVGHDVTRLRPGDRVLGHALGLERGHANPAEGAFQHYVVLRQNMLAPIPDTLSFREAAVLPLGVSTAASGLFQEDHLGLALPADPVTERGEAVLVWGGSTSVGSNAIQLARNAGYHIVATASAHNFDYVRSLGAAAVADYRSRAVIDDVVEKLGGHVLAGVFAIGAGSVPPAIAIANRIPGTRRIATVDLGPGTMLRRWTARLRRVRLTAVRGTSLKDSAIGAAIYGDFLSAALASGRYLAAPDATVVGHGLDHIPDALRRLRDGVSAAKLVVTT